mmetsp:Transcript_42312/g.126849  ORF Transcript_42312/g.126849 Transcript_42312/m.126849 type:complete len:128 (-) Transcript_42312:765-1148(-)|eukprot:365861-Chlamydomonas_euryale.AAC.15
MVEASCDSQRSPTHDDSSAAAAAEAATAPLVAAFIRVVLVYGEFCKLGLFPGVRARGAATGAVLLPRACLLLGCSCGVASEDGGVVPGRGHKDGTKGRRPAAASELRRSAASSRQGVAARAPTDVAA